MVLTKAEKAILDHRLEVPDAIAEALTNMIELDRELVYELCNRLREGDYDACLAAHGEATRWILWDAVDGSTIGGCNYSAYRDGDISKQQYQATIRCGEQLAIKINKYIGATAVDPAVFRDS